MIEFIIISLFAILVLAYYTLGRNFSRPTILYVAGFLICSIVALYWKEEWDLHKMSSTTAFVIIGGAISFYIVEWIDYNKHKTFFKRIKKESPNTIQVFNTKPISNTKLILFFCFQLFAYMLMAKSKMDYASADTLSDALVEINDEQKFENRLARLPFFVNQVYFICSAASTIWTILLSTYIFRSNKCKSQKILITLNFVISIIGSLLTGGRTGILYKLISFFTLLYINFQYKYGWKGGLFPKKVMITIAIMGVMFVMFFAELGYAIGRKETNTTRTTSLLFAIYCGAEIKNLDDYIKHSFSQGNETGLFAQYTLCGMYNNIIPRGKTDKDESRRFNPDLRFNRSWQYPLGNMYTTYYNYILDFGYWGAIICAGFMSIIVAFLYRKVITSKYWLTGHLDLWMLFFSSHIPAACFLSFFGNHFFGSFTIQKIIKELVVWWVLIYYFQRWNGVQISRKNKKINV